jgi:glutamate synthase domain-containing protein 2
MTWLSLPFTPRYIILTLAIAMTGLIGGEIVIAQHYSVLLVAVLAACAILSAIGIRDLVQTRHSILRNYPIAAHLRFFFEEIRPELRQYLFESETDGAPFSRDTRAIVYQRAKMVLDKRPFGTQSNVYADNFEWLSHSLAPLPVVKGGFRVMVGGPGCALPYSASVYNISAMSFGALSANAIRALSTGAKAGGFAQDTGEGGLSPYHMAGGGDIIWEVGSGYFGCRSEDGSFSPDQFARTARLDQVKMVELKLSQGAKPGHGGVLPAAKVSAEIARIRGVPEGRDCISPARHSAFATPIELIRFVESLRQLSGGKPAGFKLCIGQPHEFLAICKAMLETGLTPDFIVIDGKEGGTGAAPQEFIDHIGMPMRDGLNFAHNALIGCGLRDRVRIGAAGKIVSAFDMARAFALGADWCNAARGFMFAIGCIQSQSCHTDRCPVGVATQDESRQRGLVVAGKAQRVANFHAATLASLAEVVAAAGLEHPRGFTPNHILRRVSPSMVKTFGDLYPPLKSGELLTGSGDPRFKAAWEMARPDTFVAALP